MMTIYSHTHCVLTGAGLIGSRGPRFERYARAYH
jgi:hypothetical protein